MAEIIQFAGARETDRVVDPHRAKFLGDGVNWIIKNGQKEGKDVAGNLLTCIVLDLKLQHQEYKDILISIVRSVCKGGDESEIDRLTRNIVRCTDCILERQRTEKHLK